jgi:CheY-like chemotaxis protein
MSVKILWADDEIDLLKPHIFFLKEKGFDVLEAKSGDDALEILEEEPHIDIVFLDENMPGLTGLETLQRMKAKNPTLPIIMITKSEEEEIMESAIGGQISDYLIKPVNPNQILLSIKKNLDTQKLVSEKTTANYQQEFRNIGMRLGDRLDEKEWVELYKDLVHWEIQLEKSGDDSMKDVYAMQKSEANAQFCKYVEKNYVDWISDVEDAPTMSHQLLAKEVFPLIEPNQSLFLVVIDNLRFDQWKVIRPLLEQYFRIDYEDAYYGILPTATQYARNALFAGMMPADIERMYPKMWLNENDEGSKNQYEKEFLEGNLKRHGKNIRFSYHKVTNLAAGKKLVQNIPNLLNNELNAIVYNFVDMLSHARTEMEVIRELADDEAAYRSIAKSWFEHSALFDMFKIMADKGCKVVVTTDHGSIRVNEPVKVTGDKNTNTNLRYKVGKTLQYNEKDVFSVPDPQKAGLPRVNVSSTFIFAREDQFFAYPNNYNYYVGYYRDTFQHGGISMEECLIPLVVLKPKA